jgi:hypothetical protein
MSEASAGAAAAPSTSAAPESTGQSAEQMSATEVVEDIDSQEAEVEGGEEQSEQEKKETKAEKALRKKYALKVNNKVKELELDLENDAEVQRYLQKALAADEKFQEAANMKKGFSELISQLKNNPLAILMHPEIGVDVKKLAEQVLNQEIEDMSKTPEQKRIEELEKALKDREEREKSLEEEKRQAEMAKLEEQTYQELDEQISAALDKSELPRSPYVVKRIADTMLTAMEMGYANVSVEQIMPFVEQQIVGELNQLFEMAPEQSAEKLMEKFVGKKNLDKYRKTRLAKAKAKAPETAKAVRDTGAKSSSESKQEDVETVSVKKLLSF